jgi:hypothetical protein
VGEKTESWVEYAMDKYGREFAEWVLRRHLPLGLEWSEVAKLVELGKRLEAVLVAVYVLYAYTELEKRVRENIRELEKRLEELGFKIGE